MDPIPAAVLGQIAGIIGRSEHTGRVLPTSCDLDQTDTDPHAEALVLPAEAKILGQLTQRIRNPGRLVDTAMLQQHAEFVAAKPGERVSSPDAISHQRCNLPQQFVTRDMPAGVVDDLESIEVHEEQRMRIMGRGVLQDTLEAALELPPIDQPGQRIMGGLMRELLSDAALFGNVAKGQNRADLRGLPVENRRRGVMDMTTEPAAVGQQQLSGRTGLDHRRQRRHGSLALIRIPGLMRHLECLRQWPTAHLMTVPAGYLFGDRVQKGDVTLTIGGDHAVADAGEGDAEQFLLHLQPITDLLEFHRALRDPLFEHPMRFLQCPLNLPLLCDLRGQRSVHFVLPFPRPAKIVDQIEVLEAQPERPFDRRMQTPGDDPQRDDEEREHGAHQRMRLPLLQEHADREGRQGRYQEQWGRDLQGRQRGDGTGPHTSQHEGQQHLMWNALGCEKADAGHPPEYAIACDSGQERALPHGAAVGDGRRTPVLQ